ncbi:MAG: pyridoxal phosphate-dependent decarboxylase family protein [Myxococcota bacterium]
MPIPATGAGKSAVIAELAEARAADADWKRGRTFSLVYFAGEDVLEVLRGAYAAYIHENGLSLDAFPSLRRFEGDVLRWCAELFHAKTASLTSGGTESILMAVKAARDWARVHRPEARRPEILVPVTAHPAFDKAAHVLGVGIRHAPVDAGFRADVAAMRELVTPDTILLVGTAFTFPHGVVDPIPAIASLARERGVLCHVDACLGGFVLAFAGEAGGEAVDFDFRVPGVTSMSADLHKYGYAAKGASVVLYGDKALRRHQFFATTDWPGGIYGSPTMAGTRPGGAIAAAWAVMRHLGRDGYVGLTRRVLATSRRLREGIAGTPGLRLLGDPRHSVIAFAGEGVDVFAVDERMRRLGWHLDRLQQPAGVQMIVTPAHEGVAGDFLADLAAVTREVREGGVAAEADGAIYGAMASIPDRGLVRDLVLDWIDGLA